MNLFLQQPWHERVRRAWRRRNSLSMAERRHDASERPISLKKVAAWTGIVLLTAVAYYLGEAVERKRLASLPGIYQARPAPQVNKLDCVEARRLCRVQDRMAKVKL